MCGVSVRFYLEIKSETKEIVAAKFKTNGCGFVIATADHLAEIITGRKLTELHGLGDLEKLHKKEFGEFPEGREHCADICFDAISNALSKYRSSQIGEWAGETALICSCFGVSEDVIEEAIAKEKLKTVEEVGENCNAGFGCGSCQPLIEEILYSENT